MPNPMLKNQVDGCHGNHAFFIVQKSLSLRTKILYISGVSRNDLATMKKCHGGARWVKLAPGEFYEYLRNFALK